MDDENMEFIFLMIALDCGPVGYVYPCLKIIAVICLNLQLRDYLKVEVFLWPYLGFVLRGDQGRVVMHEICHMILFMCTAWVLYPTIREKMSEKKIANKWL